MNAPSEGRVSRSNDSWCNVEMRGFGIGCTGGRSGAATVAAAVVTVACLLCGVEYGAALSSLVAALLPR
jgi:hypothetical protein